MNLRVLITKSEPVFYILKWGIRYNFNIVLVVQLEVAMGDNQMIVLPLMKILEFSGKNKIKRQKTAPYGN